MQPQDTISEEWRAVTIPEFAPFYAVSNLGRVMRTQGGTGTHAGRIRQPVLSAQGYYTVLLTRGTYASRHLFPVHRLVALAFLPDPPDGRSVNHINGIRTDNRITNLEWATPAEQNAHASRLGLLPHGDQHHARRHSERMPRGTDNSAAKFTDDEIRAIRQSTESQYRLAQRYHTSQSNISLIRAGKTWRHLL